MVVVLGMVVVVVKQLTKSKEKLENQIATMESGSYLSLGKSMWLIV